VAELDEKKTPIPKNTCCVFGGELFYVFIFSRLFVISAPNPAEPGLRDKETCGVLRFCGKL
jgi:hypothetical protein